MDIMGTDQVCWAAALRGSIHTLLLGYLGFIRVSVLGYLGFGVFWV